MATKLERIVCGERLLAVIMRRGIGEELRQQGKTVLFATPDAFGLQLGVHNRSSDEEIEGHFHIPFTNIRELAVQEFFFIYSGSVAITLYDSPENQQALDEVIINTGDAIVLNTGHSLRFLSETQMLEIKQGPYRGRALEKIIIAARS